MVVFDIGANLGFYTMLLARRVGRAGRVHAFEPDPLSFLILEERLACRSNVELVATALAAHVGRATLYCGRANRADNRLYAAPAATHSEQISVLVTTVDQYCAEQRLNRLDGLKIDVQGSEVSVLAGATATLASLQPSWLLVEFEPALLRASGATHEDLWEQLTMPGYAVGEIDRTGLPRPIVDRAAFGKRWDHGYTNVWVWRLGWRAT